MPTSQPDTGHYATRRESEYGGVRITAPARLHCGLLNTSGLCGRIDGGVGFSIAKPRWVIEVSVGESSIDADLPVELAAAVERVLHACETYRPTPPLRVRILDAIPLHAGFGSKTALLLAVARAAASLTPLRFNVLKSATLVGRGGTSGIGVHSFNKGQFVWDAGHAYPSEKSEIAPSSISSAVPPPNVVAQFPCHWISIVHFRFEQDGPHGEQEQQVFERFCPTPHDDTLFALKAVKSFLVPGLLEQREDLLQEGIRRLQQGGLKRIEWEYQGSITSAFRHHWTTLGRPEALGLSSFGPTMYVVTTRPESVVESIKTFGHSPLHLVVTSVNNMGYSLETL